LKDPGIVPTCPGGLACPCSAASECPNGNCVTTRRNQGFCDPEKGDVFPNFRLIDQFGNPVELYDFANQGQWVIVEMAAAWCPGCNDLAAWFASGDTTVMARAWWKPEFDAVRDLVASGKVRLVTVLYQGSTKAWATPEDVAVWAGKYKHDDVAVVADSEKLVHSWVKPTGIPAVVVLNEKMEVVSFESRGLTNGFLALVNADL